MEKRLEKLEELLKTQEEEINSKLDNLCKTANTSLERTKRDIRLLEELLKIALGEEEYERCSEVVFNNSRDKNSRVNKLKYEILELQYEMEELKNQVLYKHFR